VVLAENQRGESLDLLARLSGRLRTPDRST